VADLPPEPQIPDPVPADQIPAERQALCAPSEAGLVCYLDAQVAGLINSLRDAVRVRGARFEALRAWTTGEEPGAEPPE